MVLGNGRDGREGEVMVAVVPGDKREVVGATNWGHDEGAIKTALKERDGRRERRVTAMMRGHGGEDQMDGG